MRLSSEWKKIVRRAWSFRLNIVAGVFSALEFLLPLFIDVVPRGTLAAAAFFVIIGSNIMRIVAQRGYDD